MPINLHPKMQCLFEWHRYIGIKGGRGSAKSHSIATAIVDMAVRQKEIIFCTRRFQNSIEDSAKALIVSKIEEMGYRPFFDVQKMKIICKTNGTEIRFNGLQNPDSLQSMEGVTVTWIEEAHAVSRAALKSVLPTVMRHPRSRLIASWNPHKDDPIHTILKGYKDRGRDVVLEHTTYLDNPYLPDILREQAEDARELTPEEYRHIWLGEELADDAVMRVVPRSWLDKCIEAHTLWKDEIEFSSVHGGLDPAESPEGDKVGFAIRRGPELHQAIKWTPMPKVGPAPRAHRLMLEYGGSKLFYDAGGVGSPLKRDFVALRTSGETAAFTTSPFLFGGEVQGKDRPYIKSGKDTIKNGAFFSRVNAQAWWNIRQRAENTVKRLNGADIPLASCLLINPDIQDIDELIDQLSGATYDDGTGKIKIDKRGDGDESPDMADAVIMAFLHDIRRGLKA